MATDAFEMALVHEAFRGELHNATGLIRGVPAGDITRSAFIRGHVDFMLTALHHHHKAEDDVIWPKLYARIGTANTDVARMEGTHNRIAEDIVRVSESAKAWGDSAALETAEQLVDTLEQLCARLNDHLADEERTMVPLINAHLSPNEWRQFLARGGRFLFAHPKLGLVLAGFVLDPISAEGRKRFLANVPLPQRAAFQLLGMRVFAAYHAKLYQAVA